MLAARGTEPAGGDPAATRDWFCGKQLLTTCWATQFLTGHRLVPSAARGTGTLELDDKVTSPKKVHSLQSTQLVLKGVCLRNKCDAYDSIICNSKIKQERTN